MIALGKHEQKKTIKPMCKKNYIWIIIALIAVLVAVLAIVIIPSGDEEVPAQETMPAEQKQDIAPTPDIDPIPVETPVQTAVPTEQPKPSRKELTIDSVEQRDSMVVVNTSYGAIRYPFAFSDLIEIVVANQEEQSSLEWYLLLEEAKYPLFSITFNGSDGVLIGEMAVENGEAAEPVYMQFFAADDELEEADIETFYAVQEILNDVIMSLEDNEEFTAAE